MKLNTLENIERFAWSMRDLPELPDGLLIAVKLTPQEYHLFKRDIEYKRDRYTYLYAGSTYNEVQSYREEIITSAGINFEISVSSRTTEELNELENLPSRENIRVEVFHQMTSKQEAAYRRMVGAKPERLAR